MLVRPRPRSRGCPLPYPFRQALLHRTRLRNCALAQTDSAGLSGRAAFTPGIGRLGVSDGSSDHGRRLSIRSESVCGNPRNGHRRGVPLPDPFRRRADRPGPDGRLRSFANELRARYDRSSDSVTRISANGLVRGAAPLPLPFLGSRSESPWKRSPANRFARYAGTRRMAPGP